MPNYSSTTSGGSRITDLGWRGALLFLLIFLHFFSSSSSMHKIVWGSIFRAGVGGLKLPQHARWIRPCYNLQSDKHSMPFSLPDCYKLICAVLSPKRLQVNWISKVVPFTSQLLKHLFECTLAHLPSRNTCAPALCAHWKWIR